MIRHSRAKSGPLRQDQTPSAAYLWCPTVRWGYTTSGGADEVRSVTDPAPAWGLVEALATSDVRLRMAAVAELRALGRAASPALERGLVHDRRAVVRRWCSQLLGLVPGRTSACALLSGTHDRLAIVRLLCLQALATRAATGEDLGLDLIPHVVRLARSDRSKRVRAAALESLAARPRDPRAAACLAAAVADAALPRDVRQRCLAAAASTAPPAVSRAVVGFGF